MIADSVVKELLGHGVYASYRPLKTDDGRRNLL